VRDDPSDFIGWTYLLQYVDGAVCFLNFIINLLIQVTFIRLIYYFYCLQKNIDAAREAYDAFLDLYPYCYGYWRKYADYERKNGTKENCEKVS